MYPENNPFGDRGKLVGYFTVLEFKDGRRGIPYIRIDEVTAIEDKYGQKDSPAYKKSLIDMHRKTAMKKMLKPYMKICEGLAMLMQLDDASDALPAETADAPLRDVTDRTASRLDRATASIAPVEVEEEESADESGPRSGRPYRPESRRKWTGRYFLTSSGRRAESASARSVVTSPLRRSWGRCARTGNGFRYKYSMMRR